MGEPPRGAPAPAVRNLREDARFTELRGLLDRQLARRRAAELAAAAPLRRPTRPRPPFAPQRQDPQLSGRPSLMVRIPRSRIQAPLGHLPPPLPPLPAPPPPATTITLPPELPHTAFMAICLAPPPPPPPLAVRDIPLPPSDPFSPGGAVPTPKEAINLTLLAEEIWEAKSAGEWPQHLQDRMQQLRAPHHPPHRRVRYRLSRPNGERVNFVIPARCFQGSSK